MILAILQARVSSSRLPGKVIKPILGKPMLLRQIERIMRADLIDKIVVATSEESGDDAIADLCKQNDIFCFRGKIDDVLDRFYQAAKLFNPEQLVRLTGDCPLTDPELIDRVISYHITGGFDYTGNALTPTFPDGLDVEVFRFACLKEAWEKAILPSQREHVTPYIYQKENGFKIGSFQNETDLSDLRWTVDEVSDFELVSKIYEALYPQNKNFNTRDILTFLDQNPTLKYYNIKYQRNEGYRKSLIKDSELKRAGVRHQQD